MSDPEQERGATQAERDLAWLQQKYGPPQPREPLPDQPELGLPGLPIYTARAPRPATKAKAKTGRGKKKE